MTLIVLGASNLDYTLIAHQALRQGHSNPASLAVHAGGVGRNVAETLGRLGESLTLLTALTPGVWREFIVASLPRCVRLESLPIPTQSSYVELLDQHHDLHLGLAAMDALDALTPESLTPFLSQVEEAQWLAIDLNFPAPLIDWVIKHFKGELFVEGTSAAKVFKILPHLNRVHTLKLNDKEAFELTQEVQPSAQAQMLINQGVQAVTITLGKEGVYHQTKTQKGTHHPSLPHPNIVSTTGAGDAYFAGLVYAHLHHLEPHQFASRLAHTALSVATPVNPSLSLSTI